VDFGTVTAAPYNNPAPDIGSGVASVLGMDNNYTFSSGKNGGITWNLHGKILDLGLSSK
jgi:hypothetical protein